MDIRVGTTASEVHMKFAFSCLCSPTSWPCVLLLGCLHLSHAVSPLVLSLSLMMILTYVVVRIEAAALFGEVFLPAHVVATVDRCATGVGKALARAM